VCSIRLLLSCTASVEALSLNLCQIIHKKRSVTVSNVVVLGSNTRETDSVAVVLFVIQFLGSMQQTHSVVICFL
jgi:hypothetical protein